MPAPKTPPHPHAPRPSTTRCDRAGPAGTNGSRGLATELPPDSRQVPGCSRSPEPPQRLPFSPPQPTACPLLASWSPASEFSPNAHTTLPFQATQHGCPIPQVALDQTRKSCPRCAAWKVDGLSQWWSALLPAPPRPPECSSRPRRQWNSSPRPAPKSAGHKVACAQWKAAASHPPKALPHARPEESHRPMVAGR